MNSTTIGLITLRGTALALALAGQTRASESLYALADAIESGATVDSHMAEVAAKLSQRDVTDADWADVTERINSASARLHKD